MGWKLSFHFVGYPNISLYAFITADDEIKAKERFKTDYPNLAECVVDEVIPYVN